MTRGGSMLCVKQCIDSGTPFGAKSLANYLNMKQRTQKFSENLNGTPRRQKILGIKNHSQTHAKKKHMIGLIGTIIIYATIVLILEKLFGDFDD